MVVSLSRLTVAFAMASLAAFAGDDSGLLHITNANMELTDRTTLQVHTRVRSYRDFGEFFQFRAGPILMHQFAPRALGLAGYYITIQDTAANERKRIQRFWAGPQFRALNTRKLSVDTRHLAERFVVKDGEDYMRFRNRAMLIYKNGHTLPFVSAEVLYERDRWYPRYTAGIQWRSDNQFAVGIGYEYRASPNGPGIHLISTMLQFRAWRHTPPHID